MRRGQPAGEDRDKVIEIREHKDILSLDAATPYEATYNGRTYTFTRQALLETREINTGVVAFRERALRTYIQHLDTDNAQGELLLTDLVQIFNQHQLVVRAATADSEEELLAFNVKSVWRQMEAIARRWAYDKLKDTITIADEEDFFIADEVIEQILNMDEECGPLDIVIGKGTYIGPEVQLNRRVTIGDRSQLSGPRSVRRGRTNRRRRRTEHVSKSNPRSRRRGRSAQPQYPQGQPADRRAQPH